MSNIQGLFREKTMIVLASGSPRRRDMLAGLGLAFVRESADVEEPGPEKGEDPADYAMRMAALKGRAVAGHSGDCVVLAADTVVALPGRILGKPGNPAEAFAMLRDLTGEAPGQTREHVVVTGVHVTQTRGDTMRETTFAAHTTVAMGHYDDEVLKAYVATGEPMDKAGAYGIQGLGSFLVTHVEGSYTNVVGLPLARVLDVLLSWDVIVPW